MRSPVCWFGGKGHLWRRIVPHLPRAGVACYVEPFGGGASILLNLDPYPCEVYNDLDAEVVDLFRALRDHPDDLQRRLRLTPYAREEFGRCLGPYDGDDPVERARRLFVRYRQAFSGTGQMATPGSWSYSRQSRRDMAGEVSGWLSIIEELHLIADRFRRVQIECLDFADCIRRYDAPDTLFYCDPPYLAQGQRAGNRYAFSLSRARHVELLELLGGVRGMVALSGYPSALYGRALARWRRVELRVHCYASTAGRTRGNRQGRSEVRTDVLWLNAAAVRATVEQLELTFEQGGPDPAKGRGGTG
jgi:DNA adenine methylase